MPRPQKRTALYRVKALRWTYRRTRTEQLWEAKTPFGSYEVQRARIKGECCGSWTPWTWTFIAPDVAQADRVEHSSGQIAKKAAEADWSDRLASVLVRVTSRYQKEGLEDG